MPGCQDLREGHVSVVEFLLFVRLLSLNAVNGFEKCQDIVTERVLGRDVPRLRLGMAAGGIDCELIPNTLWATNSGHL